LDYRTHWQQKRRRRQLLRLAGIPIVILGITVVGLLVQSLRANAVDWSYSGPDDNLAAPSIIGNLVMAAFSEGEIHCLRINDGSTVWPVPLRRPQRFVSPAAVASGTVIICADYGKVYAVRLTDGEMRWETEAEGPLCGTPLIADRTVYIASKTGKIYAFAIEDGSRRFVTDTGAALGGQPALCNGVVVAAGSHGSIVGLDPASGKQLWNCRVSATFMCPVAEAGGLAAVGSEQGRMYVVDPLEGKVKFSVAVSGLLRNKAVSDGQSLYFCDSTGWLYSIDLSNGARRFSKRLGNSVEAGPCLHRGALYCLVDGSRVVEVEAENGELKRCWRGYEKACSLAVGSYYLVVGTYTAQLLAIELSS